MNRRNFLGLLGRLIQGAVGVAVVLPGIRFLMGPNRTRKAPEFVRVARLSEVQGSNPIRVEVRRARRDAYVQHPPGPVGSVWLVRTEGVADYGSGSIRCLQATCPHLGCAINFAPDRGAFVCPCHASEFSLSGDQTFGPSPRPMDELRCRITDPEAADEAWIEVEYREFRTGTALQEAVS